jgi:CelD/BcsL family acetyltransferase involved in cellulose biosynthesis
MLELIDSFSALAAMAGEWRELCERAPQATVFQTPDWLLPWWKHLGGGDICSLALRSSGRLRALAPLFRHGMPGARIRQISLIGAGITDYLDFIAEPEAAHEFAAAVREWLHARAIDWDVVNLEELQPQAVARKTGSPEPCSVCPVIDLPDSVKAWEASLDSTHRRNVRHARARGGFEYARSTDTTRFPDFVRLHELSWRNRDQEGVLNTESLRAFYGDAAECLAEAGNLRMHLLQREGELAGAIFGMSYKGRGYAYLGGFDPALRKSSPGTVLMWHAISDAISGGAKEWDLLRGSEAYKYAWGAEDRQNAKIRVVAQREATSRHLSTAGL